MDDTLRARIKDVLVQSLRLPFPATQIADDVALFGEGLGLDSIDALEVVLAVERTFGVTIGDEETAKRALKTVNALADLADERRAAGLGRGTGAV